MNDSVEHKKSDSILDRMWGEPGLFYHLLRSRQNRRPVWRRAELGVSLAMFTTGISALFVGIFPIIVIWSEYTFLFIWIYLISYWNAKSLSEESVLEEMMVTPLGLGGVWSDLHRANARLALLPFLALFVIAIISIPINPKNNNVGGLFIMPLAFPAISRWAGHHALGIKKETDWRGFIRNFTRTIYKILAFGVIPILCIGLVTYLLIKHVHIALGLLLAVPMLFAWIVYIAGFRTGKKLDEMDVDSVIDEKQKEKEKEYLDKVQSAISKERL